MGTDSADAADREQNPDPDPDPDRAGGTNAVPPCQPPANTPYKLAKLHNTNAVAKAFKTGGGQKGAEETR